MFKSSEPSPNPIFPDTGSILMETGDSKLGEFTAQNQNSTSAMQPNMNESFELGVSIQVDGDVAASTLDNFDAVTMSENVPNHDTSTKSIEPEESKRNVSESAKDVLEMECNISKPELPRESTRTRSYEKNEELAVPIDMEANKPTSDLDDGNCDKLREDENISQDSEMNDNGCFGSLDREASFGIKKNSPADEGANEIPDSFSCSEDGTLLRDGSLGTSRDYKMNSSTSEDAKILVDENVSLLREDSRNEVENISASSEKEESDVTENLVSRGRCASENGQDEKDAEIVDNGLKEEMVIELPRDESAATSESTQSIELSASLCKKSTDSKLCDNESILTSSSELTDGNCEQNSSRKDATETEDDAEKEEGELEEGELDDDIDEEKKDVPNNLTGHSESHGSASDEDDKHDDKKVSDVEEKKRKKKVDGEDEPKRKKKKRDHFYEDGGDDFRKHSDFDAMLEQYRRKAAGEEDDESFKGPGYDEMARHKRRPPLLSHSKAAALCVSFLEGTCNKGNECQFSHNMNHSISGMHPHQRKMELCKFYQMGCCAKKQKCSYMHKDFPCKLYHTGMKCVPSDKCQYSHDPLSHITKSILLKHIEMAPKDILGTFPRLNNTAAQQIIAVTEMCRNKRPCDIDSFPGIRDWRAKGFKYVDRAIRSFDRKNRRAQAESAAEDELGASQDVDRSPPHNEGSLSPGHQGRAKTDHREHRPKSGAENEEGSGDEDRKHTRSRKRHRWEDEESSSQARFESSHHHKHRSDSRSSRHDERRRQRMIDHHKREESRLEEPSGRNATRFDYGGRDAQRMEDPGNRSSSRRRASRWGDDREDAGGSLSPGSSPNAHRHGSGRSRPDFLDNGEGNGKHSHKPELDRHSSRERRGWQSSDDDGGRRNRRYDDPGLSPSSRGDHRESSEDDASTAAIAAAVDSIPSMLDSFKRNSSSSHLDHDVRMSDRLGSESDRATDRLIDRDYTLDRSSSRTSANSDRFNASSGDNNEESRACQSFPGRYDPLEIFRRQQMQESASTREAPILGSPVDGTVEYSPYLKNFKKVPSAAVSPVRPTPQQYAGLGGTSVASSFEVMPRDRDVADPRKDSAGLSNKEFRRSPPPRSEVERSSSVLFNLNLNDIKVPSDLAQVLHSLKGQTGLPKSDSAPAAVTSQPPPSKVSPPPPRENFLGLRDSPSMQESPYLKSFRSWSPSTGNQVSKDQSTLMSDPRQRPSAEMDYFKYNRSDSMPQGFSESPESRSNGEHAISDPRRGAKDQILSSFRDPRLTRGFLNSDQSSRSARSSSDSDDRSNDPVVDVDLKRLRTSNNSGPFMSEIPFEIPHHEPVTVINASITANPPMMYRLVEVTVPKVNLESIKSRFDKDHPRVHEDPRLFKMFFSPDASEPRSPGSIVYEDPQSPPPVEVSPSQGTVENRDPRINRDPRAAENRNVDPRVNTDPRINSDPRRSVDIGGNCDPRSRNAPGPMGVLDPDVRLAGDESPDSRGGDPRLGNHTDPRLENRRSDPRLNNRDPRANRNLDGDQMTNAPMGEAYPPGLLGNAPNPMVPFGGPAMANLGGSSSIGLLNGPPGMTGHMAMPMAGPMSNMYPQNMMNHPSQPPDMRHKMPHNMGPSDMNPYASSYGVGPHGPAMMGPGMGNPSVPSMNSMGKGSHLGMNSNFLPAHSLQGNWPPSSNFQNTDPRLKKN